MAEVQATHYYLDANSLLDWAEGQGASPIPRLAKIAQKVESIIENSGVATAISWVTLVEYNSNVFHFVRSQRHDRVPLDGHWAALVQDRVWAWLSAGQLEMLPSYPKAIERGLTLVREATRDFNTRLHAWDAVHVIHAVSWARLVDQKVTIVTSDSDFTNFLQVFPEFGEHVLLMNPEV